MMFLLQEENSSVTDQENSVEYSEDSQHFSPFSLNVFTLSQEIDQLQLCKGFSPLYLHFISFLLFKLNFMELKLSHIAAVTLILP